MTRIIIAGTGGVGGYFGGLLARRYHTDPFVEIVFLARGTHLECIRTNGLKVLKGPEMFTAHPHAATAHAHTAGPADFILVCTKTYDLEAIMQQLLPCITPHTVLVPLQNGVEAAGTIRALVPHVLTADACTYLVSHVKEAGVIENTGTTELLYFGQQGPADERLHTLEKLLTGAGIRAQLCPGILRVVWEKFIFLSPTATATSFFDCSTGALLDLHTGTVQALIKEVLNVARTLNIPLAEGIFEKTMQQLKSLPYAATTSMQRDFRNRAPETELDALTYSIIRTGRENGVSVPVYESLYAGLKNRL